MKPKEDVERFLKDASASTGDAMDRRVQRRMHEVYASSAKPDSASRCLGRWGWVLESRLSRLAVVAAVVMVSGLLAIRLVTDERAAPVESPQATESPLRRATALSLSMAYRRGGMEAVDRQYREVMEKQGPKPAGLTIEELLVEDNNL